MLTFQPAEILEAPEQKKLDQKAPFDDESAIDKSSDVNTTTVDWTVSEDYDTSNIKTKPPPRESVEPTYRGWKEVGRWEQADALTADDEAVDLLSRGSVFDTYLPKVAYGDWYHNVAYLVLGGLLSWIVGWFRFSMAPVFFIMVASSVLYRSSIRTYRQVLREQAQREFSIKSIEDDYETMDWLNVFMEKFWHFLEPSVSQIVTEQVNPILAASPAPAFIKALWLDSFTAGTKPPRIDTVKTLQGTADDVVVMDWGCSFTPNEVADLNYKQMKNKVNEKVVVKVNVFGFEIPVAVSDVSFKCLLRVRLRMMSSFPHIETVNVSLLEPPQFDFNSRLLGDSTFNWEVLAFPGLYPFINQMIKKYVGPILYAPLSFQLNVEQLMAGAPLNSAIGVLVVTVRSAKGLKNYGRIGNTVDPYCNIGFLKKVLAKTTAKSDTSRPTWNETVHVPISSLSEPLSLTIMDSNGHRNDNLIGSVQLDLDILTHEKKHPNITAPVVRNNKPVGELLFGLHFMPALMQKRQPDGAIDPPPDLNTGIARIEVAGARNLKGKDGKPVTTYAEVLLDGKPVIETSVVKNNNSPAWGAAEEKIIFDRAKTRIRVIVRTKDKKVYGSFRCKLNDLIDATMVEDPWFQLSRGGEIQINTNWKPVMLEGASGAGGYSPPMGVVRVVIDKAEDLRNLETIGKVDPYARVLVNGTQRARTAAAESTLNPTWGEVHYIAISSPNQKLTLEVMDVEKLSPDRTLGSFDVRLNELIQKDERGRYIETVDNEKRVSKLIHKKGPKGTLTYSVSFYPTLPVMSLEDYREEEEEKKADEKRLKELEEAKEKEDKGAQKDLARQKKEQEELEEEDEEEEHSLNKLRLSLDQLLEYKSGVFIYEILEIDTSKDDCYLQVFADNHGLHDFVTPKLRQKKTTFTTTGDVIVKELEWSKINFRLAKKEGLNRSEKAISEVNIPTIQLLKNGYKEPTTIQLSGSANASVKIRASWVPIVYASEIPPQDSYNNSGYLNVNVIDANNLPAGDSNGKSDPYVKLYLNTDKDSFFKSKKVKKTLDPTWNETTSVAVLNKYDSIVRVVVFDWDVGPEQDDFLCEGYLKLADMSKEGETEFTVPLKDEDDNEAGEAHFKLSFKPDFILNVRPESSDHIGEAFGAVGTGVGAVGHVGKGVGKGLGKGVGTVGKGLVKGLKFGKSKDDQ